MPLITITSIKGRSIEKKKKIGQYVHEALMSVGVPEKDRFQKYIDLDVENLVFDPTYPNLEQERTSEFTIIEILFSVGRSVKIKKEILKVLIPKLEELSIASSDVFVSFQETAWENWSFANGEIIHS